MTTKISTDNIQASALTALSAVKVSNVAISNSTYYVLDDTAVNVGGGYIVVTGSGFVDGATVLISGTQASAVTYVDSTELHVQVPAKSAATYNLYVVNPDGSTAIRVNGLTYSGTPTWVTTSPLDNQAVDVAFNLNFDATGATSYSNTSALPAGTDLLSNGYFYGTVTGIAEETTYNFTIQATDAENQDSAKTFSVTVTVAPSVQIYSFGYGQYGQLGNDTSGINYSSPVQIGAMTDWSEVIASRLSSFALKSDGTLWAWGFNSSGQLGQGDNISRSSPVQIGALTNWSKIYSRSYAVFGIKTDGTLWVWGGGDGGTLGLNTQGVNKSSPVQLGTSTWTMIAPSRNNCVLGIKTDGTLWGWGTNTDGRLGLSDQIERSSPVQVGVATDWSYINFGQRNAYAIKTNGSLWVTGQAAFGALGQNQTATNQSAFSQVGALQDWALVSSAAYGVIARKTNGTLWSWGAGNTGMNGKNDVINRSSPAQIGSSTDWQMIATGYYAGFATKTDGTLWSWGNNGFGKLGLNVAGNKSSPTQIGTDVGWGLKSSSDYHVTAYKTI